MTTLDDDARSVVLVEGHSDRVALETLAARRSTDLAAAGVRVVPVGGVTNVRRALGRYAPRGLRLTVLCDQAEHPVVRRAVELTAVDVAVLVCVADLEEELIRAAGTATVLGVIATHGEDRSFAALRQQPAHRRRTVEQVLRRFMGSRAGRKATYAELLVAALPLDGVPAVLDATLAAALSTGGPHPALASARISGHSPPGEVTSS